MTESLFYQHLLYRLFDADDQLLYVGRTNDLRRRFERHAMVQPWWAEVARSQVESLGTFEALCEAERAAIVAERPKYNITHNAAVRRGVAGPVPIPENPSFVLIGDQVLATTDRYAEEMQCTAISANGRRCRRGLDVGQTSTWHVVRVPGGSITAYDLNDLNGEPSALGRRYLAQLCEKHADDEGPFVSTEWVRFDPDMHEPWVTLTADSAVDAWMALAEEQRFAVLRLAPGLATTLERIVNEAA